MEFDPKHPAVIGLGTLGVVAAMLAGVVNLSTPGEDECMLELTDTKVELAEANTKATLRREAIEMCRELTTAIQGGTP